MVKITGHFYELPDCQKIASFLENGRKVHIICHVIIVRLFRIVIHGRRKFTDCYNSHRANFLHLYPPGVQEQREYRRKLRRKSA